MYRVFSIAIVLLSLSGMGVVNLYAQTDSESENVGVGGWATLGVGSGPNDTFGLIASTTLGRTWVVQGGITSASGFFGGDQMSLLYLGGGRSSSDRAHHATLAVAPALVYGKRSGDDMGELTGGLIVTAQAAMVPLPPFGIGVSATAHLNSFESGVGLGVILALIDTK